MSKEERNTTAKLYIDINGMSSAPLFVAYSKCYYIEFKTNIKEAYKNSITWISLNQDTKPR